MPVTLKSEHTHLHTYWVDSVVSSLCWLQRRVTIRELIRLFDSLPSSGFWCRLQHFGGCSKLCQLVIVMPWTLTLPTHTYPDTFFVQGDCWEGDIGVGSLWFYSCWKFLHTSIVPRSLSEREVCGIVSPQKRCTPNGSRLGIQFWPGYV